MVEVFFGKAQRDDSLCARLELCVTERDELLDVASEGKSESKLYWNTDKLLIFS